MSKFIVIIPVWDEDFDEDFESAFGPYTEAEARAKMTTEPRSRLVPLYS